MRMGMIGLGRMGANMVRRLARGGHECVAFDQSAQAVQALSAMNRQPCVFSVVREQGELHRIYHEAKRHNRAGM